MYDEWKWVIGFLVTFLVVFLIGWVVYSSLEAKAYNEITGKHVTTGQAMFLQLRVDNPSK